MNQTGRSVITATRKRKHRDIEGTFYNHSSSQGSFGNSLNKQQQHQFQPSASNTTSLRPGEPLVSSSRLLAGYMAYEFLTHGTLFGQKFDPARAEAVPVAAAAEPKRKPKEIGSGSKPNKEEEKVEPSRSYKEVAHLLKADGAHIPGIVNPTQLHRWIQM